MQLIIDYIGAGTLTYHGTKPVVVLTKKDASFSDISNIVVPFFNKYSLLGVKLLDYTDWCIIVDLMSSGSHLTQDGLNLIREIKSLMNTGRNIK